MSTAESGIPEVTDEWLAGAEGLLAAKMDEASALRFTGGLPSTEQGTGEVLARLANIRSRLDRVEVLLDEVARFRTGMRVLFKEATARADDRWSEIVAGSSPGGRRRGSFGSGEVEGPRERYARAEVLVFGERHAARRRERVMDAVTDAYDSVDRVRRGLDAVRFDLHAMLRVMAAPEHRLDRTDA